MVDGSSRYDAKRAAGISPRRYDGSYASAENDRQAEAAERFAAHALRGEFNGTTYATRGDGGHDFRSSDGRTVEVIWLGFVKDTAVVRTSGHLIVNPEEPQRWADLYVVVAGSVDAGFWLVGWATHVEVCVELRDFGYGPKYALHTSRLRHFAYRPIVDRPPAIEVWRGVAR